MTPGRSIRVPDGRWQATARLAGQLGTNREAFVNKLLDYALAADPAEVAGWLGMAEPSGQVRPEGSGV